MIFLQAAPDAFYFYWQLEIQLFNFKRLGIDLTKVHHVFVGWDEPSKEFNEFKAKHPEVNICFYKDTRKSKNYIPSLRPNGLKQHFAAFPELENEVIFYHDADIIFTQLPNFEKLSNDDVWYLSDTNSYLNADYIKSKGDGLLEEMCSIIGVNKNQVENINLDSGGAQYILKGVNAKFWEKVENDCEKLYTYLQSSIPYWAEKFSQKSGQPVSNYHEIQSWCSDMWCVLWNGLLLGKKVKVVPEMDFSWATDSYETFKARKIFHNAGITEGNRETYFYKGDYIYKSPLEFNFEYVNKDSGSRGYVEEMMNYKKSIL